MPLKDWNDRSELILAWSRGATTERLEGFQPWVLAGLTSCLSFDHAIWAVGVTSASAPGATLHRAHVHHGTGQATLGAPDLHPFEQLAPQLLAGSGRSVCLHRDDPGWVTLDAWNDHATRHRLAHLLCVRSVDARTGAIQFIALGRTDASPPFTVAEIAEVELLAPHMMQAYSTRCEVLMRQHDPRRARPADWVTAIVDRAGTLCHRDAEFLTLLEREWPGSDPTRVPAPLCKLVASTPGQRVRHVGREIVAEFSPTRDLFLLSLRVRVSEDTLSERERAIAQEYSAGASYKEIAAALQLSPSTVRAHVRMVFLKLGVRKKAHLANLIQ